MPLAGPVPLGHLGLKASARARNCAPAFWASLNLQPHPTGARSGLAGRPRSPKLHLARESGSER